MLCKIGDLFVELPEEEGIGILATEYKTSEVAEADIVISAERYRYQNYPTASRYSVAYNESGAQFYSRLLYFGGMMLHASAVELNGRAYLFSGPSGVGKSTHTALWQREFPSAVVFNDDKPALRNIDGRWFAYGTPWSGKNHVNSNMRVPLAGICFLRRGTQNSIRKLSGIQAVSRLVQQTMHVLCKVERLDFMLRAVESLAKNIPIYELSALPNGEAARLTHDTMLLGAQEAGL